MSKWQPHFSISGTVVFQEIDSTKSIAERIDVWPDAADRVAFWLFEHRPFVRPEQVVRVQFQTIHGAGFQLDIPEADIENMVLALFTNSNRARLEVGQKPN